MGMISKTEEVEAGAQYQQDAGKRHVQIRWIITSVALLLSILAYVFVAGLLGPNRNLFSQIWRKVVPAKYTIFSGGELGFYIKMGQMLESRTSDEPNGIIVKNQPSTGAINNARKVMVSKKSFGFVQEDTLRDQDFERNHIRYITPLYLERLHIVYDKAAYTKFRADWGNNITENPASSSGDPPIIPILTRDSHPCVKAFFANSRVSIGPPDSGTQLYSRYLLDYCGIVPKATLNLGFKAALKKFSENGDEKINVVVNIAGAPLLVVIQKLENSGGNYALMGIDSAIAPELNRNYNLKLRSTTFSKRYRGGDTVSTIATYCFLICSPDVPDADVLEFLRILKESRGSIKESFLDASSAQELTPPEEFQLGEFDFYGAFSQKYEGFYVELAWNIVIFVSVIVFVFTTTLLGFSRLISEIRRIQNLRKITEISHNFLPDNATLETDPARLPKPVIYDDQGPILSRLITGMSELVGVAIRIRNHYDSGELRMKDYEHLRASIQNLREVFQQNLAQRLNEFIDTKNSISPRQLRHFFTAGYLQRRAYITLRNDLASISAEDISAEDSGSAALEGEAERDRGPRVFLSYRHGDDMNIVSRLYDCLTAKFPSGKVFFDKNGIVPGAKFPATLRRNIVQSDAVLAIVGKNWLRKRDSESTDWVMVELETASDHEIPIIPVLLEGAEFPVSELPDKLQCIATNQTTKLRIDPDDFAADCARLAECVESLTS